MLVHLGVAVATVAHRRLAHLAVARVLPACVKRCSAAVADWLRAEQAVTFEKQTLIEAYCRCRSSQPADAPWHAASRVVHWNQVKVASIQEVKKISACCKWPAGAVRSRTRARFAALTKLQCCLQHLRVATFVKTGAGQYCPARFPQDSQKMMRYRR